LISVYAVAGILQRENKILVAERPVGKPYSGFWEFPGGKIEADESGEDALKRELHEELGIIVNAAQLLFKHEYSYPDKFVFLEIWRVMDFSGEPQGRENQALAWVTIEEMLRMNLLEGNFPIVERLGRVD